MQHIAIMRKSWGLTQKILSREKIIETRWYKNKARPWNFLKAGETIFFKDSGKPVTLKATISKVEQFEDLNEKQRQTLIKRFSAKDLGTTGISQEIEEHIKGKRYAIIIHLKDPKAIRPFQIDKTGYGTQASWLSVKDIKKIKRPVN
ncbi:MAG: hypothetical protein UT34_C0002G0009 [candidate division WS6 bacterium GW2011_GWF2_39_15]|uniref:ASCH domain-containing protein n=1 Tax=candidate division WS6 bacterium GW2011_GWF2_39_15 TaxID=1619100 RepID=A0A0G0QV26_9BACT|nr:MAG: hypothetical protein UT34_C0002G0009 [candidate division WS6 bacterium GW2011_GWF2_39_15]